MKSKSLVLAGMAGAALLSAATTSRPPVTFSKDVAPILQKNCQTFAQGVTWGWLRLVLAAGSFLALQLKVNVLWTVLIGAGLSIALCR